MPDEEMDDIIRDASNQHYPAYDDQAWNKMERLLDKHLPQKKDKRKYLLFLLLFLLMDTGLFFIFFYSKKHADLAGTIISNETKNTSATQTAVLNDKTKDVAGNSNSQNVQPSVSTTTINTNTQVNSQLTAFTNNSDIYKTRKIKLSTKAKFKSRISSGDVSDIADNITQNNNNDLPDDKISTAIDNKTNNEVVKPIVIKNDDSSAKKIITASNSAKKEKKKPTSFDDNFAFTISAGPGLSYVGLDYLGKTTFSYGAGLRYNFAKRFAVRTGFYVTKKIYSANPSDYHPPENFWTYFPNLQQINADCKVYEIPVNVSYAFAQRKKHNWFAAMGLTTYLMKQEVYDYYSKGAGGQTLFTSAATINNQNKNIFSIATLSGGYQYNINNRFSIAAEPYIELPLSGIGFGKINLNSGGLLFTAIIKPFTHNK